MKRAKKRNHIAKDLRTDKYKQRVEELIAAYTCKGGYYNRKEKHKGKHESNIQD